MTAHVYGIFHMVKKLFASGRFSRQGAFRACFYGAKRAAKTREEILFADAGFVVTRD